MYTPPDYCGFSDLLTHFGQKLFDGYPIHVGNLEVDINKYNQYSTGLTFVDGITFDAVKALGNDLIKEFKIINDIGLLEIENKKKSISLGVIFSRNNLRPWGEKEPKEIEEFCFQVPMKWESKKDRDNLKNLLKRDEIRKRIRDALVSGKINAYCLNKNFEKIPSTVWLEEKHWFSLMLDDAIYLSLPVFYSGDSQKETRKICFKKEEVEAFLSLCLPYQPHRPKSTSIPQTNPLIDLSIYHTPWLEVQQAIYNKYGKGGLAKFSKECIKSYIQDYIKEKQLNIADSDISYLAKFMRLEEQKQGRAYQAKIKKT